MQACSLSRAAAAPPDQPAHAARRQPARHAKPCHATPRRSLESFQGLQQDKAHCLAHPDVLISAVGTRRRNRCWLAPGCAAGPAGPLGSGS
jgi:hypothetical protein